MLTLRPNGTKKTFTVCGDKKLFKCLFLKILVLVTELYELSENSTETIEEELKNIKENLESSLKMKQDSLELQLQNDRKKLEIRLKNQRKKIRVPTPQKTRWLTWQKQQQPPHIRPRKTYPISYQSIQYDNHRRVLVRLRVGQKDDGG